MSIDLIREKATAGAIAALDYYVRNQIADANSADCGRYPFIANCATGKVEALSTNWITGIQVSVMLNAHAVTGDARYLDSARLAVRYLSSLQEFKPWNQRTFGAMHENVPQGEWAHPRDGLSAALGLLDYALATGEEEPMMRAKAFAEWFVNYGMEPGYPYWTLRFDDKAWEPAWHGSFHSGSGYFLIKLAALTGEARYLDAARKLLDFYNANLLSEAGDVTVIRRHDTLEVLDECADPAWAPIGWIMMHKFNDDFGALANLALGKATGEAHYTQKAMLFLNRMRELQRADGGFGPAHWTESVPNAAGVILTELLNARRLGAADASYDRMAERAAEYLLAQQFHNAASPFDGAFHGMSGDYTVDPNLCNGRATTYAIMALLGFAGHPMRNYTVE